MEQLLALLNGKKTYLAGIAGLVATFALGKGWISPEYYTYAYYAVWFVIAMTLRAAITNIAPGSSVDIPLPTSSDPAPTPETAQPLVPIQSIAEIVKAILADAPKGK